MPLRKPNTFIIGAPKCGTSAMVHYLSQHPNAYVCNPKEPFFWSQDYPGLQTINNMTDIDSYRRLFENATDQHSVICEGSTNYLASTVAVSNILDSDPDAKFIAMLRNPVDVVHAFHSEILFSYFENEPDFEKAWELQGERSLGRCIPKSCPAKQFLQYRDVASYAPQLTRFFKLVPEKNRKVIIYEDFAADNATCFEETLAFLNLPALNMSNFERINAAHGHKFPLVSKMVLDPPGPLKPFIESVRFAARKFKGGWVDQAKHWLRKPTKRTPLRPEFRSELCQYFAEDVRATSAMLNRDLSHWVSFKPGGSESSWALSTATGVTP